MVPIMLKNNNQIMSKIRASSKSATFKSDKRSIHTKINNYKDNYIGVHTNTVNVMLLCNFLL